MVGELSTTVDLLQRALSPIPPPGWAQEGEAQHFDPILAAAPQVQQPGVCVMY
jgi:hypothetical protein